MTYFDGLFFLPPLAQEDDDDAEAKRAVYSLHFCRTGRVLWHSGEEDKEDEDARVLPAPVVWWTLPNQRTTFEVVPPENGETARATISFYGPRAQLMHSGGLIRGEEFAPPFALLQEANAFERAFAELVSLLAQEEARLSSVQFASGRAVSLLEQLLLSLCENASTAMPLPLSPVEQEVSDWLELVKSAPQREWNIADAATNLSISPGHFRRVCRRLVAVSPYQFVLEKRLDAASERLRSSKEPIKSLAPACGFKDLNQFARLFAARYHLPPARYRRANRIISLETARLRRRQKLPDSFVPIRTKDGI